MHANGNGTHAGYKLQDGTNRPLSDQNGDRPWSFQGESKRKDMSPGPLTI